VLPLYSPRLRLRRFTPDDLGPFLEYRNDLEVARYQGWDGCTQDEAAAFIRTQAEQGPGIPGQWLQIAIALRETDQLLGDCGLKVHARDPRQATIGVTLARPYQRIGYATEALVTLFDYVFGTMNLHRVVADTDPENTSSWRLLQRLGMRREGHTMRSLWFKRDWADEYLYGILAEEWRSRGPAETQARTA
jgi:aminoglycoside 6'-N-acetyltransferase